MWKVDITTITRQDSWMLPLDEIEYVDRPPTENFIWKQHTLTTNVLLEIPYFLKKTRSSKLTVCHLNPIRVVHKFKNQTNIGRYVGSVA